MFGKKKEHLPQKQIDSLIGAATTINGDLDFDGGLRVDGRVLGHIHGQKDSTSTLVIGETGKVEGEIRASHVVIRGQVNGPVVAEEYLELLASARVTGDISYKRLEMHVGAVIDGRLLHLVPESADVVEIKRTTAS